MKPVTFLPPYSWDELVVQLGLSPVPAKRRPTSGHKPVAAGNDLVTMLSTICTDGGRTNHLTAMIGKLLAAKYSARDALARCHEWNAKNDPPLDDDKVDATFGSILASDRSNHPERYSSLIPLFPLVDGRIDAFLTTNPPPRRWLVKDLVAMGKAGAVVAPGGSSKSQWLLQLAVSVASGLPVAEHWQIGEVGNVIVFSAEDDGDEIHRRIKRIADHLGRNAQNVSSLGVADRLHVFSTIGTETLLTKRSTANEIQMTDVVERIGLMADQLGEVKLIVIDPASRFRGGEENSNEDGTRFVEALEALAQRTGAAVLIAHHANKGAYDRNIDPGQGASRGASALTDGLRWQMNLSPPTDKQLQAVGVAHGAKAPQFVAATVTKSNYAAFPDPVILERLHDGVLSVVSAATAQRRRYTLDLQKLLTVLSQQGPMTSRALEDKFGGVKGLLAMPKHRVREVVDMAVQRGMISGGKGQPLKLEELSKLVLGRDDGADGGRTADAEGDRTKTLINQQLTREHGLSGRRKKTI